MNELELDRLDIRILNALQGDGRLSNQDLADSVGLSPPATWRRLKRLQDSGLIRQFVALVDEQRLGYQVTVFAYVTLVTHERDHVSAFTENVMQAANIQACYCMGGNTRYLLKVVAKSVSQYTHFLEDVLLAMPNVASVSSDFVLNTEKDSTKLPIDEHA